MLNDLLRGNGGTILGALTLGVFAGLLAMLIWVLR
jgi:hypothetical protein